MSWGMRSPNLSASGQSALTDGVAAPQGSSAVVSTERWKWKRRSWCPRDILSLREAGGGRLLKMPFPFYCSPVARRLAGLVLPSSLAAFSLLSLAAGTRASLPPSPQALLPREAGGEGGGHGAMPHKACGPGPGVSSFCCPLCHSRFLSRRKMFSLCLAAPSLQSVAGREQWDGRAGLPPPRPQAAGTRFGVVLGHVRVKGLGVLFSGAKPCFSKSFEWPLVPPTARVASPSDPEAGFEANGSLCRTWGAVLVCVGLLSVRYEGILGFAMN